jgi:S1 RNA binding domain protein
MTIELGSNVKGIVVSIVDYGAIVRLADGKSGLIHISEIANNFVDNVRDYLAEEDEVTVKVLKLNKKGRYELSLKQCDAKVPPPAEQRVLVHAGSPRPARQTFEKRDSPRPAATFEDRLSRFMKDSEQRQQDLKRHLETKRRK